MELTRRVGKKRHKWSAELKGKKLTVQTGPEWGDQKKTTKTFGTPAKATEAHAAAVAAARKQGFRVLGELDAPKVPIARNAALEAAIRESRGSKDHAAAYLVYADWLQSQGCPIGDAIVFAAKKKTKEALAIAKQVGIPQPDVATVGYAHGLWDWLRMENSADWMDTSFDPVAAATPLFAHPLCSVLRELRLGVLRWDYNAEDVPAVLAVAGKQPWAKDLERLHLGDVSRDIDMDHHTIGPVGKVISKHFPKLARLKLHSGAQSYENDARFGLEGFDLPHLRELVIETCGLSKKRAKHLAAAKFPQLAHLELWFGDPDRDGNATVAEVAPIVDGKAFPKLTHLGLCNTVHGAALVERLAKSPLARQLTSLDFGRGTFDDAEAGQLAAAGAKVFPAVVAIGVDDTYVSPAGVRALRKAFPKAKISQKEQKEFYDFAPGERYVSIGE